MIRRLGKDSSPPRDAEGTSRRQFLRRAGLAGALSAAVIGGAEVMGLSSASAVTKRANRPRYRVEGGQSPDVCTGFCNYTYTPRQCNGGKSCPSGQCCFTFTCGGTCGTSSGKGCRVHSCNNYSICCH
jgi:hypothetical protein